MAELPLRRLVLYKHGVGYFERRGTFEGTSLSLHFSREAMDDVLKSLIVIEMSEGRVRGIDYERPESWSGRRMDLGPDRTIRDLIRELRGRKVRVALNDESVVDGLMMGIDEVEADEPLAASLVSVYRADVRQVVTYALGTLRGIQLLDSAADEVSWSLRSGAEVSEDRTATIQLDPGKHELLVAYLAPAPSWRVSYRLMVDKINEEIPELLLQGWGLIDNVLNEDLNDVRLSLVAGRPVSFRYALYEPQQPQRPLLTDLVAPTPPPPPMRKRAMAPPAAPMAAAFSLSADEADEVHSLMDQAAEAAPAAAEGAAQGTLFRYDVREPISVGRGRSALVPLLNLRTNCRRELVYVGRQRERHPMTLVRFDNTSGFALERGPVTIIEQRSYGGEAVIPWTVEGGEVSIRYSLALELTVREEYKSEQWTRRLRLGRDLLIHEVEDCLTTIYVAANTASEERVISIEHPISTGYEIFDTAVPEEQTSNTAVWRIPVPARGEAALRVRERRLIERSEAIRNLSFDQLRRYLSERMLDQTTVTELRSVLSIYARLDAIRQRYAELEQRRKQLHEQQTQVRGNLDVLHTEGEEGELRTRYIATLAASEDELVKLREEETTLRAEEQQRRSELEAYLRTFGGSEGGAAYPA